MVSLTKALLLITLAAVPAQTLTTSVSAELHSSSAPRRLRRRATPKDAKRREKAKKAPKSSGSKTTITSSTEDSGSGSFRFFGDDCAIDQSQAVQQGLFSCVYAEDVYNEGIGQLIQDGVDGKSTNGENYYESIKDVEQPIVTGDGGATCEQDDYCCHKGPHYPICAPISQTWSGPCICPYGKGNKPDCPTGGNGGIDIGNATESGGINFGNATESEGTNSTVWTNSTNTTGP